MTSEAAQDAAQRLGGLGELGGTGGRLPRPRGRVSALLVQALAEPPTATSGAPLTAAADSIAPGDVPDEDLHLAMATCYELHYRGFDGVDERWEWHPSLLALRAALEQEFERTLAGLAAPLLVAAYGAPEAVDGEPSDARPGGEPGPPVHAALRRVIAADDGPSLSTYVRRRATLDQVREFLVHKSVYQLKEADPYALGIPRLAGRAKAALVEILIDEYGGGRPERVHATMYADTMRAVGLDGTYGGYLDVVPASTLAAGNLSSLFGLHRRWRGALLGHLAVFEMTSAVPARRYGDGLRRLGFGRAATEFFDEHVAADAVHEQIAAVDLCGSFVAGERDPVGAARDVLFGAASCLAVEGAFAAALLDAWDRGESALSTGRAVATVGIPPTASASTGVREFLDDRRAEAGELVGAVAEGLDA